MLWQRLENMDKFKRAGTHVCVDEGFELDTTKYIGFLEKGIFALETVTPEGNERTYMYFKAGNLMGFMRHILPADRFPETHLYRTWNRARARTRAELSLIEVHAFFDLIEEDPDCHKDFTTSVAQNMSNLLEHSALVACENAPVRICTMLLEFSDVEGGRQLLPPCFNQQEVARFLALHKITVSKVFKSLRQAGYIKKQGQRIEIVNPDRLSQVVDRGLCIRY